MLKFSSQLIYVRTPRSIDPTIISVFVPIVTFPLTTTFLLKVVVPLVILSTLGCIEFTLAANRYFILH
jgi:hypothetical protein